MVPGRFERSTKKHDLPASGETLHRLLNVFVYAILNVSVYVMFNEMFNVICECVFNVFVNVFLLCEFSC